MADDGRAGQSGISDNGSNFNQINFMIDQRLNKVRTMVPVKILSVTGTAPNFTVSVQPQINQVDGLGNATPHGEVFNIPMASGSGGNGAVVVKPKVGDLGFIGCCDRDISAHKASTAQANPGSGRSHDMADGIYMGGFGGMNSPSQHVTIDENGFNFTGNLIVTGSITATGGITAGFGGSDSVTLQNHTHSGGPKPDAGS